MRNEVAQNPNISGTVLEKLASDRDENVREKAIKNPNLPISILEKLSKDRKRVRRLVANRRPYK